MIPALPSNLDDDLLASGGGGGEADPRPGASPSQCRLAPHRLSGWPRPPLLSLTTRTIDFRWVGVPGQTYLLSANTPNLENYLQSVEEN